MGIELDEGPGFDSESRGFPPALDPLSQQTAYQRAMQDATADAQLRGQGTAGPSAPRPGLGLPIDGRAAEAVREIDQMIAMARADLRNRRLRVQAIAEAAGAGPIQGSAGNGRRGYGDAHPPRRLSPSQAEQASLEGRGTGWDASMEPPELGPRVGDAFGPLFGAERAPRAGTSARGSPGRRPLSQASARSGGRGRLSGRIGSGARGTARAGSPARRAGAAAAGRSQRSSAAPSPSSSSRSPSYGRPESAVLRGAEAVYGRLDGRGYTRRGGRTMRL